MNVVKTISEPGGSAPNPLSGSSSAVRGRILLLLHLITGISVALIPVITKYFLGFSRSFGALQWSAVAIGVAIVAVGFSRHRTTIFQISSALCLVLVSLFVVLAVGEVVLRIIGFDFARQEKVWRELPPAFRQPIVPTGKVFFRREGPERWTGRPLNVYIKGSLPNPYTAEPVMTIEYNGQGFRNPQEMKSWEIAVAGDSFTELGYLPYDQLFTSILARALNVSVLNLGTSYTGPLTQLSYLQDYGLSAGTKHVLIVFYEGNDLDDLSGEYSALERWNATGQRDYREFQKQPSLLVFLYQTAYRLKKQMFSPQTAPQERNVVTAYFKSGSGDVPVTLAPSDGPPGRSELPAGTMQHLQYFFSHYADFGRERRITIWLAYMPTKLRVLHGNLEFSRAMLTKLPKLKRLESWKPNDLPALLAELCTKYGVRFIDLTPALIRETGKSGRLLYNSLYDTHLNQEGSRVVGEELALHLKDAR